MADALQAWLRGDTGEEAAAAGTEVARLVGHVIAYVEAHQSGGG
jgi:hypothetical protein